MCGFLCLVKSESFNKFSTSLDFGYIAEQIKHRGPDSKKSFCSKYFDAYFYRLSIRDTSSHSDQPIETQCKRYIFVFNGELYGYKDNKDNDKFISESDTNFLSKFISKKGIECLSFLRGMFAICIYDRLKNEYFFVRDSIGIKPLFYRYFFNNYGEKIALLICSEQSPILETIPKRELNSKQAMRFLKMGVSADQEETFFDGIKRFLPGNIYKLSNNNFELSKFELETNLDRLELNSSKEFNEKDHKKDLEYITKTHFVSDRSIATTISAGIDSSYISILSNQQTESNVDSYTLSSELFNSEIDKKLRKDLQNKVNLKEYYCENKISPNEITNLVKILSSPFGSSSWIFQNELLKYISCNSDSKVVLVGEGSDEIYSGYKRLVYPYLYSLEIDNNIDEIENSISTFSKFLSLSKNEITLNYKNYKKSLNDETDYDDIKFKDFFIDTDVSANYERYFPKISSKFNNGEEFYKSHLIKYLRRSDIPSTLEILDHLSMRYSLELRTPFLDTLLIQKVFKYSYKYHFGNGYNKYILRSVATDLPKNIRFNKIKKQRPNPSNTIIYDILQEDFLDMLKFENRLMDTKKLKDIFLRNIKLGNKVNSNFWFRIYTYLKFCSEFKLL